MDHENDRPRRLFDKLLDQRIIMLSESVMPEASERILAQLLYLDAQDPKKPIHFYINTPGGSISDGFAIFDTVRAIRAPVTTICTGMSASMGTIIMLAPPDKKRRVCLPNTRFLLHQPSGGVSGHAVDIGIEAEEIVKMRKRLNQVISEQTGRPLERVEQDTDRNFWMSAEEAREYGIVGRIVGSIDEL